MDSVCQCGHKSFVTLSEFKITKPVMQSTEPQGYRFYNLLLSIQIINVYFINYFIIFAGS